MSFCRVHAFYDCPLCRGEEPVWVIPVVEGRETVGEIRVGEGTVEGLEGFEGWTVSFPEPVRLPLEEPEISYSPGPRKKSLWPRPIPIAVNPWLLAKVKLIMGGQ